VLKFPLITAKATVELLIKSSQRERSGKMSLEKHPTAELAGFGFPYFPKAIEELNRLYDSGTTNFNGQCLEESGRRVAGYKQILCPTTDDKYMWFWGLVFNKGAGSVAVLFPWGTDEKKIDNSRADRSIAVYCKDCPEPGKDADEICELLAESFKVWLEDLNATD